MEKSVIESRHDYAVQIILDFHKLSYPYGKIARMFGYSESTIVRWIKTRKISKSNVEWIISIYQDNFKYVYYKKDRSEKNKSSLR